MEIAQIIGLQPFDTRDTAGIPQIEDEQILQHFPEIQLVIATDADLGYGTLHITDSQVIWLPTDLTSQGYSIPFTSISMHAISSNPEDTTTENTPPCLYVQLNSLDDDDDNDNATVSELRLIPKDSSLLDTIFQSFCQGAERNPDPDDDDTDNGGGGFFFNSGAQMEMEGQDDDRFDDDDEDDRGT